MEAYPIFKTKWTFQTAGANMSGSETTGVPDCISPEMVDIACVSYNLFQQNNYNFAESLKRCLTGNQVVFSSLLGRMAILDT